MTVMMVKSASDAAGAVAEPAGSAHSRGKRQSATGIAATQRLQKVLITKLHA